MNGIDAHAVLCTLCCCAVSGRPTLEHRKRALVADLLRREGWTWADEAPRLLLPLGWVTLLTYLSIPCIEVVVTEARSLEDGKPRVRLRMKMTSPDPLYDQAKAVADRLIMQNHLAEEMKDEAELARLEQLIGLASKEPP